MRAISLLVTALLGLSAGCTQPSNTQAVPAPTAGTTAYSDLVTSDQQEAEIRALIEQLVFDEGEATNQPVYSPGVDDHTQGYRNRYVRCQDAFDRLTQYGGLAIPIMVEHLEDERQSMNFRNHFAGNSVGDACFWNIYFQLTDRPSDYSAYGLYRQGRDGQSHTQPYWRATPFDEGGGLRPWLEAHEHLSYTEMQIVCLTWLLEEENAIGASDADSYFLNILPLEIQILKRKLEAGHDVQDELDRMQHIMDQRLVDEIPPELLPTPS